MTPVDGKRVNVISLGTKRLIMAAVDGKKVACDISGQQKKFYYDIS